LIDFKKFNTERAWWRDSRGLNDFTEVRTLIVVGTPCRNLLDLSAEYTTLTGKVTNTNDPNFKAFVNRQILADIRQCFGRKMGARCQPGDLIVFVSDFDLDLPAQQIKASDITIAAASKSEQMKHGIKQAIAWLSDQGKKVTQQAIADFLGKTRAAISHYSQLIFLLLETLDSKKIQNSDLKESDNETYQALAKVVSAVVNSNDPLADILAAIHEIFFDWMPSRLRRCLLYALDLQTQSQLLCYLALITGATLEF
jgi:predicted transcriptional regulator